MQSNITTKHGFSFNKNVCEIVKKIFDIKTEIQTFYLYFIFLIVKVRDDGDMWCWCNTYDFCNKDSMESSLTRTSTIISALIDPTTTPIIATTEPTVVIYEG